mmetsp:Transcript_3283/g.4161  ORF Transcript_3283/g.4161 Transcript_3283/m.4161 type:complete len:248 (-) Transcript_3283:50-793(-)
MEDESSATATFSSTMYSPSSASIPTFMSFSFSGLLLEDSADSVSLSVSFSFEISPPLLSYCVFSFTRISVSPPCMLSCFRSFPPSLSLFVEFVYGGTDAVLFTLSFSFSDFSFKTCNCVSSCCFSLTRFSETSAVISLFLLFSKPFASFTGPLISSCEVSFPRSLFCTFFSSSTACVIVSSSFTCPLPSFIWEPLLFPTFFELVFKSFSSFFVIDLISFLLCFSLSNITFPSLVSVSFTTSFFFTVA